MFKMSDVLQELCEEFPEIEKSSIEKICKAGFTGIAKLLRADEELYIDMGKDKDMKFFLPCNPDTQDKLTQSNRRRRRFAELRKQNGKQSI